MSDWEPINIIDKFKNIFEEKVTIKIQPNFICIQTYEDDIKKLEDLTGSVVGEKQVKKRRRRKKKKWKILKLNFKIQPILYLQYFF